MLPTAQRMAEVLDGVVLDERATRSAASASATSATNCAPTTASAKLRR
jgi:FtsZ-interacting cell division protein ZipA